MEARRRLTENREALVPELRHTALEPPYSHAHISETAIHREIMRIFNNARRETRQIYDLGHDRDRVEEENWVIRWMLWHVFRYRDNRNRNRKGHGGNGSLGDDDDDDGESGDGLSSTKTQTETCEPFPRPSKRYPVKLTSTHRQPADTILGSRQEWMSCLPTQPV